MTRNARRGILLAQEYTNLHEANRGQTFSFGSRGLMDLYNNTIGMALAKAEFAKDMTIDELMEYAIKNNLLATSRTDAKLKNFDYSKFYKLECKK